MKKKLLLLLIVFIFNACATDSRKVSRTGYTITGKTYYPLLTGEGFVEKGLASWYGGKFHGRKTANGERYNMYDKTAAHRLLPFGSYVKVNNLENNRHTTVRINDRGPFVSGRVIDLSYTAASEIDMLTSGTALVKIEVLKTVPLKNLKPTNFTVQIGAFQHKENAQKLLQQVSSYSYPHIVAYDTGMETLYRVRLGKFSDLSQALQMQERLARVGFSTSFIVSE